MVPMVRGCGYQTRCGYHRVPSIRIFVAIAGESLVPTSGTNGYQRVPPVAWYPPRHPYRGRVRGTRPKTGRGTGQSSKPKSPAPTVGANCRYPSRLRSRRLQGSRGDHAHPLPPAAFLTTATARRGSKHAYAPPLLAVSHIFLNGTAQGTSGVTDSSYRRKVEDNCLRTLRIGETRWTSTS